MERSQLLMPFTDGSEAFTNGFECGQIWEMLKNGESITDRYVHVENRKQIEMICEFYKADYLIMDCPLTEYWVVLNVLSNRPINEN